MEVIPTGTSTGIDMLSTNRAVRGMRAKPHEVVTSQLVDSQGRRQIQQYNPSFWKSLPRELESVRAPRVRFNDPLSLVNATGYKDRRYSLSYDVIRRVCQQLSYVGAIIGVRVNQVASFARPFRDNQQIGFQIKFKNDIKIPNEEEKSAIQEAEQFVLNCGWGALNSNPYAPQPRDNFRNFLGKIVRDSLRYDQCNFEVIPDSSGRPAEFRAVDASTIRLAATYDGYRGQDMRSFQGREFADHWQKEYGQDFELDGHGIHTVQTIYGRIENIFTYQDLAFCMRNARTDLWANGYGLAEIEVALGAVTRLLWAEEYNAKQFTNGSMVDKILNLKTDDIDPAILETFKRNWVANVRGVENAFSLPMLQIPEGIEVINLRTGRNEMEYEKWINYLMNIIAGVYQIDPSEVSFDIVSKGGGGGGINIESKGEWKLKHSKDKGLRPLLVSIAEWLNTYVIDPLDSRLYLDFVGLDQMSPQDRLSHLKDEVTHYKTVNEVRQEMGLDPKPGCDIIKDPTIFQAMQAAEQDEKQKSATSPFSPWRTSGDHPELDYGQAEPVPLYLQSGDALLDDSPAGPPGGDDGGMPPGMDGMPPM